MPDRKLLKKIEDKFKTLVPKTSEFFRDFGSIKQSSRVPIPHPLPDSTTSATDEATASISSAPNILEAQLLNISHELNSAPLEQPSRQPSPISATDKPNTINPSVSQFTEWNIDISSISRLREWGAAREGPKWTQLLERIDEALKSKSLHALIAFVPNSPLPAKTLVEALLNLVRLGINIPVIQKKVYDFAQEAIEHINSLVTAVGEDRDLLKGDLEKICGVVNDVCRWASKQVSKVSLSEMELDEWKEKLTREKEMFLVTSITRVLVNQATSNRQSFIKEKLATHISSYYEHTDQRKNTCAPGTRVKILEDIDRWLSQPSGDERIYWLTGIPGSGKSTISATIADRLRELGAPIAAQYFVSRNFADTTDLYRLIPTIAKQLAENFPAAARIIHDGLKNGFPSARDEQVKSLLLRPIYEISKSRDSVVVLVDALDELRSDADKMVSLLADIGSKIPDNVRFIITSRPESWSDITNAKNGVFRQHSLSTTDSGDDVGRFIRSNIAEIRPDKPGWEEWPSGEQLSRLIANASGLFHYAATAVAWIKLQIETDGAAAKETVLEEVNSCGVGGLDELYNIILTKWRDMGGNPGKHPTRLKCFRHIVGCIVVLKKPLCVGEIIALLEDSLPAKFDVENFLQQLRSILILGTALSFTDAIPQMHKSFYDFITSNRSHTDFRVVAEDAHFATAKSCLKVINMVGSSLGIKHPYAITGWHNHLKQAVVGGLLYAQCDEEMWELLAGIGTEANVGAWARSVHWDNVFTDVANIGWIMLKGDVGEDKIQPITNLLTIVKKKGGCVQEELRFFEGFGESFRVKGVCILPSCFFILSLI